ncbi:MerR family transcriptional regulator [Rubrobacter aplysinae]|uniref:hypothetical protein n=1 Tax=Rubrobacter aplysinae TaxID=909625 RepID=UPI00064B96B2|nr:hypothetical protein [Rubrobacter aplysinae]
MARRSVKLTELEKWPSVTDTAGELGCSRQWVHKLFEAGELHGVKTRAGLLLDPESVSEYVASHARPHIQRGGSQ